MTIQQRTSRKPFSLFTVLLKQKTQKEMPCLLDTLKTKGILLEHLELFCILPPMFCSIPAAYTDAGITTMGCQQSLEYSSLWLNRKPKQPNCSPSSALIVYGCCNSTSLAHILLIHTFGKVQLNPHFQIRTSPASMTRVSWICTVRPAGIDYLGSTVSGKYLCMKNTLVKLNVTYKN